MILGVELQHLFNCDVDRPTCTPDTIVEGLDRLEAMGVSYVFPVHHKASFADCPVEQVLDRAEALQEERQVALLGPAVEERRRTS